MPGLVKSYLQTTAKYLLGLYIPYLVYSLYSYYFLTYFLGYTTITQDKSRQDIQLTNLILIKLENKGPKLDKLALYIIILIIQGKQN